MKKHLSAALAAAILTLSLTAGLTACHKDTAPDVELTTDEAATLPEISLPDLTDDRTYTDTTPYAQRLDNLFAETPVTPASDFTYESTEGGVTVTGYTGGEIVVVIPDTLDGNPVVAIAEKAFAGNGSLKAVSVPDTVTAIGKGAFEGCKAMTSLRTPVYTCEGAPFFGALFGATSHEAGGGFVPAGLSTLVITKGDSIPDYAFYACRSLETVSLPDTVTEIGDFAFYGCSSLSYIAADSLPLTRVGIRAFANCSMLLGLTLPDTVAYMGAGMLEGCGALETLTIPFVGGCTPDYPLTEEEQRSMEKDGAPHPSVSSAYLGYLFGAADYTFTAGYLPASLISVTVLEGCTEIPANAFFECASIREIRIPESVTSIGRRAFYGCDFLSAVTLPDSVTSLGDDAFHGCTRLVSFNGGKGLTELGVQCFMDCLSLKTVTLPDTVTHLPNACFSGCQSLESLKADGVKTQGKQVFRHCDKIAGSGWGIPVSPSPEN